MPNRGIAPIDPTSPVGQLRLLLGDTDPTGITDGSGEYLFYSDTEAAALLSLYGDNPRRAAARALRSIAASQTLLLKKFTSADVSVDMPAAAKELRLLADALDKEADDADSRDGAGDAFLVAGGRTAEFDWRQDWPPIAQPYALV